VLVGAVVAVCVPVTVALAGTREQARAVIPFAVLLPGAVWIGASADGLFAGVAAFGLMLLAVPRRRAALGAGIVLGGCLFLSYGLVLLAVPALAIVALGRSWRRLPFAALGAAAVVAGFAVAGFWWADGYRLVVERYYQGVASQRAYGYWVWADLACLALSAGPALITATTRAVGHVVPPQSRAWLSREALVWLPVAAAVAIVAADLSGMSKAEVERIWLPFEVWLLPAAALLPVRSHRFWLAVQAVTALAVNHLLFTIW
jgi:hypothetical protein